MMKPQCQIFQTRSQGTFKFEHQHQPENSLCLVFRIISTLNDISDVLQQEIFSPQIEEFSEGDNIFDISQEGNTITTINRQIVESYHKKSKYKPMNKIPKPGGLMEKLREMKSKRLAEACNYTKIDAHVNHQRKIQVLECSKFRRRLLLKFTFCDDLDVIDLDRAEEHHFMVVPLDFEIFLQQHLYYDVAFDLPEREFIENHFIHFGKMLKAGRMC